MAAIYAVYTSPTHTPIPNHLPTLIVTPHGQPSNILYSYLHTNFNAENYLLTPSPQGDLCVAKLFPPRNGQGTPMNGKASASDPGHGPASASRVVRCEASRNLKWSITNTGVISPIYKLSLPSPDSPDLPLFQISKPNPNAGFWSMFYFAYAGHMIPPKRIEFGKIQKNPPGPNGGGTRISITGKTAEEKAVWQTLGEGNEDCVEWVVLCAALNLLDDEILKAAEKNPQSQGQVGSPMPMQGAPPLGVRGAPVALRDPGPMPGQGPPRQGPPPGQVSLQMAQQQPPPQQRGPPPQQSSGGRPPQGYPSPGPPGRGYGAPLPNGSVGPGYAPPPQGHAPPPQGYAPPSQGYGPPPQGYAQSPQVPHGALPPGQRPMVAPNPGPGHGIHPPPPQASAQPRRF